MPHRDSTIPISLFLPFYTPKDHTRVAELLGCLKRNLDCGVFAQIYLLQDDDTPRPFDDPSLTVVKMTKRPTYLDWVQQTQALCPNHISVLANSDIWFNDSILLLRSIFSLDPHAFIALSRYDAISGNLKAHENPHWSQDTWAFYPGQEITPVMERQLDIQMGIPRCDNKIAYIFSINGYTIYNPFNDIISVHEHETNIRYYDKTGDVTLIGGMAMVHPSKGMLKPADLDVQIWSMNSTYYKSFQINKTLENWVAARIASAETQQGVFGYDDNWQYPAITEQHAFHKMLQLLPAEGNQDGVAYIGFPWATLIDLKREQAPQPSRVAALEAALNDLVARIGPQRRILTVCQHIRAHEFPQLFTAAGITDVYWPHAVQDQPHLPGAPGITVHPFPLYPVQQTMADITNLDRPRRHLFSFIGARATNNYLTQARNWILDELEDHRQGLIVSRDTWHYNKIVYDKQIKNDHSSDNVLIDQAASKEFQQALEQTIFSLCPSGSGPNSIRLWEAALNGSIPVVMADTYRPPGEAALWDMATVYCRETPEDIRALPTRLGAIAADPALLHRKRMALYLLTQTYGPARFVHDILSQMQAQS